PAVQPEREPEKPGADEGEIERAHDAAEQQPVRNGRTMRHDFLIRPPEKTKTSPAAILLRVEVKIARAGVPCEEIRPGKERGQHRVRLRSASEVGGIRSRCRDEIDDIVGTCVGQSLLTSLLVFKYARSGTKYVRRHIKLFPHVPQLTLVPDTE